MTEIFGIFCFGYPFVMAFYWMTGGLLFRFIRERHEPLPDSRPELPDYPLVTVLVPCFNEEDQASETFSALTKIDYPNFEIIAINDGSRDGTTAVLNELSERIPNMRVVHLATNQGKSTALNAGALVSNGEILVGTDGDSLLDPQSVRWIVRRFQSDGRIGAITGNPRIRNRSSLLGRIQVGEFSTILGLIKRAQTVYGSLFTVSGVICAFRKRALFDAGWWDKTTLTEDVDVSWRLQLAGWLVVFEPKAMCWILMPETLRGLWRQRLRWSEGGTATILKSFPRLFGTYGRRLWPVWVNYALSIIWSYAMLLTMVAWVADLLNIGQFFGIPAFSPFPDWWGTLLAVTYLLQSIVSVGLDFRFERGIQGSLFWIIWYPLLFWMIQLGTAIVGLPRALMRGGKEQGRWVSPDRGITNA